MFRKCLPRTRIRHVLFLFMTSLLGLSLYSTLCFHLSQSCPLTLKNTKICYFAKDSLCDCFFGLFQADRKKLPTKKFTDNQETSRHSCTIVISNILGSNAENSKAIYARHKTRSDTGIQNITLLEFSNSKIKKDMDAVKLDASKDENSSIQNRLSRKRSNYHPQNKHLMNVSDHSCNSMYPQVVLYNRIFKTASTTMSTFLEKCSRKLKFVIKKETTEKWSSKKRSHPILTRIQKRAKYSKRRHKRMLAISHFYFRIDTGIKMRHTYINLLREPIDRFVSHYYYARSPNRWPIKLRKLKALGHWNVTLEQCIEKQYDGCKWNTMTRFFCGPEPFCRIGNKKALSTAKYNMRNYYSAIGIVEHLNEFIRVLHKRLPKFIIKPGRTLGKKFVTTGVKKTPISRNVMAKLIQANQADIELYNFAKTLFLKQARLCGIKFKQ